MAKIDKKYHKLLRKILKKGTKYEDPNRKGVQRIQIPSYTIKHDFKDGFPAITTKKLYWKGVVGELLWFLRGDTNIKYLHDNNIFIWHKDSYNYALKKLNETSEDYTYEQWFDNIDGGEEGDLGRVYGAQWRDWSPEYEYIEGENFINSTDQISNLIKGLKENPMGTRHIVTAWNPAELDDMALPPCHWSFEILVEPLRLGERVNFGNIKGHLSEEDMVKYCDKIGIPKYQFTLKWHQRSVDTFLGLPFNIASYALLAQIIGKMANMKPKGIIGDLSNVHIYEPHLDAVKEQLSRDVNKFPNSKVNTYITDNAKAYYDNFDKFINSINIEDFEQEGYESYPRIPAEMLAYNK